MSENKSITTAKDITALLNARNPLLWIVTREEERVEGYLVEAAAAASYVTKTWDIAQGVLDVGANPEQYPTATEPMEAFTMIRREADNGKKRTVWIMRDLVSWITAPVGLTPQRALRNLVRHLPNVPLSRAQAIIILSPSGDVPAELANHATVIEWPLPDRAEIAEILEGAVSVFPTKSELARLAAEEPTKEQRNAVLKRVTRESALPPRMREAAIDAAVGLSGEEAQACFAKSLVQMRRIDPVAVTQEKQRVIARGGTLEFLKPLPGGLANVGGLDNFKVWLDSRKMAATPEAREYGLPAPRGSLLVGVPGCGKTYIAKALATEWGVPLLKLDLGSLKSKFVGESEANLRKAERVIEAIGRCIVLVDEIEKSLAGATQGAADGGVSADALGSLLSWMQDRTGEAFILATANDIESITTNCPELLRKGRFDEIWFVDTPNSVERVEVLRAALTMHGRGEVKLDHAAVAEACEGFTGSEIASLVPDAMFIAFADGQREITTRDLLSVAETVVKLTETAAPKIAKLRDWAATRARAATSATKEQRKAPRVRGRVTDL